MNLNEKSEGILIGIEAKLGQLVIFSIDFYYIYYNGSTTYNRTMYYIQ